MRHRKSWCAVALLLGACAVPNIDVVDSLDDSSNGATSNGATGNDDGGTKSSSGGKSSGNAGTKSSNGNAGEPPDETGDAGMSNGGSDANPGGGTTSSGGTRPSGGAGTGGGTTTPPAGAVGKFCNDVSVNQDYADFELRVGSGSNLVSFTATTGSCTPVVGKACRALPTGTDVPLNVYYAGVTDPVWTGTADIAPGDPWIFLFEPDYSTTPTSAMLVGNADRTTAECASTDFGDLPIDDGGGT